MDNREILARLKAIEGARITGFLSCRDDPAHPTRMLEALIADLESAEGARPEPGDPISAEEVNEANAARAGSGKIYDLLGKCGKVDPDPDPDRPIDLGEIVYHWDESGTLRRGIVSAVTRLSTGVILGVNMGGRSNMIDRINADPAAFTRDPFPRA